MNDQAAPGKAGIINASRILAPFFGGLLFFVFLLFEAWYRFSHAQSGISGFISESFSRKPIMEFGRAYGLKIFLPFYLVSSLFLWLLSLGWGAIWRREWRHDWTFGEALGFSLAALGWAHLVLWWQVPSTLWVMPGFRALPFVILFPLMALIVLIYPVLWLNRRMGQGAAGAARRLAALGGWLLLWSLPVFAPQVLPRMLAVSRGGKDACKMLILGIDGLRSDTFLANTDEWQGVRYKNAYTPIPATRLLWHILWGGEPLYYTVGHVSPSVDEVKDSNVLPILREASEKGWKPRFYIDDGGTIGLAGRNVGFDDVLMPARGWENFVNSNLAVCFPLYADWENWAKPFPTTNPWAPFDMGLKEALRLGRGSKWVMFHTCLAHQPIFLKREELAQLGRWWTLSPDRLEPTSIRQLVTDKILARSDERTNPFRAYQIRMASILKAWEPIWNGLEQDPDYGHADRFLFSDHGERFYHVTQSFQLQGIHGYNLDPWETHAAFLVAGTHFPKGRGLPPKDETLSLLCLRDAAKRLLESKGPLDEKYLESLYPQAPLRYHTLDISMFTEEPTKYLCLDEKDLAVETYILPDGLWYTVYKKSALERAAEVSVGVANKDALKVYRPLPEGGAHEYTYQGYELKTIIELDKPSFLKRKAEIEKILEPGFVARSK